MTAQVVYKEREVLRKYKTTQEFQRMSVGSIEHKSLLDDEDREDSGNAAPRGGYEETKGEVQKGNSIALLQEFAVKHQEVIEKERQEKIHDVCNSLQNVRTLFQ